MQATPFIIYVIIMIIAGIFNYQKKQKTSERKQAGSNTNTPKSPQGFPPIQSQRSKPTQPNAQLPGRIPNSSSQTRGSKSLQGPQSLGSGKPLQHPIDIKKAYEEQQKKNKATLHGKGRPEIPRSETVVSEVRETTETAEAQKFWKKTGEEQTAAPIVTVTTKQQSSFFTELNAKTIAQGIVLAEILQPPRARRPYRPVYEDREK